MLNRGIGALRVRVCSNTTQFRSGLINRLKSELNIDARDAAGLVNRVRDQILQHHRPSGAIGGEQELIQWMVDTGVQIVKGKIIKEEEEEEEMEQGLHPAVEAVLMDPKEREKLNQLADMRMQHELYTLARTIRRQVHLHTGPTNSGKTFNAIEKLKAAKNGIYCAPLRLLAWEVYEKLNAAGIPCNLRTGQEKIDVSGARHTACTVEMASNNTVYDCAVVDEIQMLGDISRGYAFTKAFLGLAAKELHLCGDASANHLIEEICDIIGDQVHLNQYERLSGPLEFQDPIKSLVDVEKGDCIVAFSRDQIYNIKRMIEINTNLKACVVYGGLPPETRKSQAIMFNEDNSGYDVLVASDAVGLGLNLNIKRIIFNQLNKFDGFQKRRLTVSEILQIAGRAGRYSFNHTNGLVTCLLHNKVDDVVFLKSALNRKPAVLNQAGILPSAEMLECIEKKFPDVPFSGLLTLAEHSAILDGQYFMCDLKDMKRIAEATDEINLSVAERLTLCEAPVNDDPISIQYLQEYAEGISKSKAIELDLEYSGQFVSDAKDLIKLERFHKLLELYVWLGNQFPELFVDLELANEQLQEVAEGIEESLLRIGARNLKLKRMAEQGEQGEVSSSRRNSSRREHRSRSL